MKINETIMGLLECGAMKITFTLDDKHQPAILADQRVIGDSGATMLQHQCIGATYEDAANVLIKHVQKSAVMFGRRSPLQN